jgi:hypothetical protein
MRLEYYRQTYSMYLAVEPIFDEDGYCLVIELERHRDGATVYWEATSTRRPASSFLDFYREPANDVPKEARIAARIKYSEN